MTPVIPEGVPHEVFTALGESLWAAMVVADRVPSKLLDQAQLAFTYGMSMAAMVSGIVILVLALISAIALRHVKVVGDESD